MINISDLEKILEIVEKHNISHFEFEQEKSKVIIDKENSKKCDLNNEDVYNEQDKKMINLKEDSKESDVQKIYIKSELAGTFYIRKEEGAEEFVKLYDVINENTVVGLIEVMKLFNEVESGINGEVIDILVKDGDFVEYGQPLFEIKPI